MLRSIFAGLFLAAIATAPAVAQDPAAGEKAFVVCRACHQIGPSAKNLVGPELNGVVGRKAGTVPGYTYSQANLHSGLTWDETTLETYLPSPQTIVKGTKMIFPGVKDPQKVKDIIAFLKQFGPDGQKVQ
uniref:c-type cytochrome n=1 Tax=Limobrevibacterium gyesilva TaxID=2991712 RepID=UPI0038D1D2B5